MMRIFRCALTLATLLAPQIPIARAAEQTDLLLVLAMDVSRSMDRAKFLLQRQGYAAAISNPQDRSTTAPRLVPPSILRRLSSPERRSRPNAAPLMCRAMAPTMLGLTCHFSVI